MSNRLAAELQAQVGKDVSYQLRFARSDPAGPVKEARLFNTQQRINGYAGRPVVRAPSTLKLSLKPLKLVPLRSEAVPRSGRARTHTRQVTDRFYPGLRCEIR